MSDRKLKAVVKLEDFGDKAKETRVHVRFTKKADFTAYPGYKSQSIDYMLGVYTGREIKERCVLVSVKKMLEWPKYRDFYHGKGNESIYLSFNTAKKYEADQKDIDKFNYLIDMAGTCKELRNKKNRDPNDPDGLMQKLQDDANIKECSDGCYQIIDNSIDYPSSQRGDSGSGDEDSSADATSAPKQRENSPSKEEGGRRLETHYRIERDPKLRERKIADARENNPQGELVCEACGVTEGELSDRYPPSIDVGRIYEVHHIKPLSERDEQAKTELSEVVVLCANCHRIVHIDEHVENNYKALKQHFDKQRGG